MTDHINVNIFNKHFKRKLTTRRIKNKIASAKQKKKRKMNILQPLLLDRSCLVNKMKKLSPLIDQLEWINTNDGAFRAYWSFYANGCKQRQQDIRQRIEQNADFVKNIKSKKAASFLKILTQDKAPNHPIIKVTQKEASNTIYKEFLECFRRPRKRDKNSQFCWQREFDDALKRLNSTRNPYDMVQIIEKLKKIEQLQSLKKQPSPYADRFKKPSIKYTSESRNKLKEVPEIQSKGKVELMKRQHKGRFLRKRRELNAPRIRYAQEQYLQKEIPISGQEIKSAEAKEKLEEPSEEPQQEDGSAISGITPDVEYSHRSEENLRLKRPASYIRTEAPSYESMHKEDEHPQRKRNILRDVLKRRHDSLIHIPNELIKKHHDLTYNRSSTHTHIPHKAISRKSLLKEGSNDDFNLWYSDFEKHKAHYTKSRLKSFLKPRRHSSVIQTQPSFKNINTKHHKKRYQKPKEAEITFPRYNPINALETVQQFRKDNPKLMAYLKKYDDEAKPRKILEPDLKPYQPNIERFTIDEASGQVVHAHKHQKSMPKYLGSQRGSVKSKSGSVLERADDLPKRIVVKESAAVQVQTSAEGTSPYGVDRISIVSGSGSSQLPIRDMSKWDPIFKQSDKSIGALKSTESKEMLAEMPEDRGLFGYKLRYLDREVVYDNPYKQQNFINRISNAFELASMDIKSNAWRKSSLMNKLSATDVKTQTALRREISKMDTRLSDHFHLPRQHSTCQRIPEPKPLIIADLIADFLKSRSIKKIFKDMHPAMFNPPQETKKPKEPKPLKINPKSLKKKRQRLAKKLQLKPKACISCSICQQLQKRSSNAMHPYMLQMQSQRKKNELRAYYKQMMLRNCQLERELQAQRHPNQHFCHVMS